MGDAGRSEDSRAVIDRIVKGETGCGLYLGLQAELGARQIAVAGLVINAAINIADIGEQAQPVRGAHVDFRLDSEIGCRTGAERRRGSRPGGISHGYLKIVIGLVIDAE